MFVSVLRLCLRLSALGVGFVLFVFVPVLRLCLRLSVLGVGFVMLVFVFVSNLVSMFAGVRVR